MALTLHTSNRLERLADALAAELRANPAPPLNAERVVVQNLGMRRWLSYRLAEKLGVAMHIEFPFPAQLVEGALGETAPVFRREVLPWRIHAALPALLRDPDFATLKNYAGDDPLKLWQLAQQLAAALDRYLAYRPEMLCRWDAREIAPGEEWQAKLWRKIAHGHTHPAALLVESSEFRVQSSEFKVPRLSVFAISTLPPFYLEVLSALAARSDVHLFLLAPTREYWGDIRSEKEQARFRRWVQKRGGDPDAHTFSEAHPLLANLGKIGREFHEAILDLTPSAEHEHFDPASRIPHPASLLSHLQHSILTLDLPVEKIPVAATDRSIQLHNCHSPLRELEILHDQLLDLFQNDASLEPRDVLVAVPDIAAYAPFIEAVFGATESDAVRFPFSIADRAARAENSVADAFLRILELAGSRYTASAVLALLDSAPVRARFDLSEADLPLIHRWVVTSGIRWGLDENQRAALGLPATREHTWRFGLDRLLLSFALPRDGAALFHGILPDDDIEGSLAATLGKFAAFCAALFGCAEKIASLETGAASWTNELRAALAALCASEHDFADDWRAVSAQLDALAVTAALAEHDAPLPFTVIRAHLGDALADDARGGSFLRGGITFCSLKPMRAIPHRIIAILGLNDDAFPRTARPPAFDLAAAHPRPGDRTMRDDDRYLFLEAILSARDTLILSHCGQSAKDNTARPPSVLIAELLAHLARHFTPTAQLTTTHRLQAFSPRYFAGREHFSYSQENERAARVAASPRSEAAPFLERPTSNEASASVCVALDVERWTLDVGRFAHALSHPARAFAHDHLGIALPFEEAQPDDTEPVTLDGLARYNLRDHLATARIAGTNSTALLPATNASGALPHGYTGASAFHAADQIARELAAAIAQHAPGAPLPPLALTLTIGKWTLTGTLAPFTTSALVRWRAGKLRAKDLLAAWLSHLALCAAAPATHPLVTAAIGIGDPQTFPTLPPNAAVAHLEKLLALHERAAAGPLPLFPESSLTFARST